MQGIRDTGFNEIFLEAENLANIMGMAIGFPDKRKRKAKKRYNDEAPDEGGCMSPEQLFKMQINNVLDTLLSQTDWRYDQMKTVSDDFSFLYGKFLKSMSVDDLKKSAADLSIKYENDLNTYEFCTEIESFKFQAPALIEDIESASPLNILQALHDFELIDSYPNINIALRIFLTIPVTSASCERSFSKLKLIKNYLRTTIGQQRISNLGIISIEYNTAKAINFDDLIDEFANMKARKVHLK